MTTATLILKNLGRNKRRTVLTIAAIALPMFVFTVARALIDGVQQFLAESDRQMRVTVHQKLTFTQFLPQRIKDGIFAIAPPGYIEAICSTSWFGGSVEGAQTTFPNMAVDRDTLALVHPEHEMTAEQIERFASERRGAVVAPGLAKRMNWELGDRVTLVQGFPPFLKLDFVIVAIPPKLEEWFYFGLDYYNEAFQQATGEPIGIHNFWLKCASPEARDWALTEIDKHFANTEHETRTEMESTFFASFLQSGGDWVGMIWAVARLIVLVAVMAAVNTMSMSFRERTSEVAVMRALGFGAGRVAWMFLLEGLALGLIGGAIAVLPIYVWTATSDVEIPTVGQVRISEATMALAWAVAIACGLLAALAPAVLAGRLRVAVGLRRVV